jgi:murE/murF fusion protein
VGEVLNLDDRLGRRLAATRPGAWTYGRDPAARVRLLGEEAGPEGIRLRVRIDGREVTLATSVPGRFHVANVLTASTIAAALGMEAVAIADAVASLEPVPGRFEPIRAGQPFTAIVDYAHTADGLTKLLGAVREITRGRVVLAFGCGGDRDAGKREPMGEVAGRLADRVVVTSDNPRSENPEAIAAAVARGVARGGAAWEVVLDRREALARALALTEPGDALVVAGRGAEGLQVFRDRVERFDDRRVLRRLLRPALEAADDPWSLGQIARMIRATVAGIGPQDWGEIAGLPVAGVSLDTRRMSGGEVFVALPGRTVDGHDFIPRAFEAGAAAVVAGRGWWSGRRGGRRAPGIHLLVDDPLAALQEWAGALRRRIGPRVLGITGSSGKTSTKEMALALLGGGDGIGTIGNRNNEIGLPWTLLQLRPGDRWAVVEMGANHVGEIARLTRIAAPDVALITGVGRAHVGLFGSVEAVREAKLEIVDGVAPEGTVVIPDDDPALEARLRERWPGRVVRFGWSERAEVRATALECRLDGSRLAVAGEPRPLELKVLGEAGARCALAALAAVRALGLGEVATERLEDVRPFPGRLDPVTRGGVVWILDVYNASPESVLHALRFLAGAPVTGRRAFVFGGMRELGDASDALHAEVGAAAGACDAGVFVGPEARVAARAARQAGLPQVLECEQIEEAVRFLREFVRPGDAVLLKGARAAALERVATAMGVVPEAYGEGRL